VKGGRERGLGLGLRWYFGEKGAVIRAEDKAKKMKTSSKLNFIVMNVKS